MSLPETTPEDRNEITELEWLRGENARLESERRTPGPATKAMLEWCEGSNRPALHPVAYAIIEKFIAEWES